MPPVVAKKKSRGGRKDLRNDPDVVKAIEDALVAGDTYKNACIMAGVSERTFALWRAKGPPAKKGTLAWRFWHTVRKAESQAIQRNIRVVQNAAARGDRQAAAWLLAKKGIHE